MADRQGKTDKRPELRARVDPGLHAIVKAIAPLKNSGEDWNLPKIMEDALCVWICQPENIRLVKDYNLTKLLKDRGIQMPERIRSALNSGTPEDI